MVLRMFKRLSLNLYLPRKDKIKDVNIEALLGREPVELDMEDIEKNISNRVIMVTGGGGSIGSELCKQIARFNPKSLLILDIYENGAYELQNELRYKYPAMDTRILIASITDRQRLENLFKQYKPEIIFHAAAHKHVPLMEDNPQEAVKNNVFGTLNVAECADKYGVTRFVMISTDKAVNPISIMGATKRICEMIIQSMDKVSKTKFVAVRFGNVLGSNGSVIPLFMKQIACGGPVTVTNKHITRYFMTISEAAQLVLQTGAFANGGEIFILDMGEPVKIYDLASDLIRLSGLQPNKDIKIEVMGLRPGDKLHEEVMMEEEFFTATKHNKILVGKPSFHNMEELSTKLRELEALVEGSEEELLSKIKELVPAYKRARDNYE